MRCIKEQTVKEDIDACEYRASLQHHFARESWLMPTRVDRYSGRPIDVRHRKRLAGGYGMPWTWKSLFALSLVVVVVSNSKLLLSTHPMF